MLTLLETENNYWISTATWLQKAWTNNYKQVKCAPSSSPDPLTPRLFLNMYTKKMTLIFYRFHLVLISTKEKKKKKEKKKIR